MPDLRRWWNKSGDKVQWQWVAPALVTAASLGVYFAARKKGAPNGADAISQLQADHGKLLDHLHHAETARNAHEELEYIHSIILDLQVHGLLTEELVYPAIRQAADETEAVDFAAAEHQKLNELMTELQWQDADSARFDATFRQLARALRTHIETEEKDLLPKLQKAGFDTARLGAELQQRRRELQREMEIPGPLR
jgi:hemerythrin superfamily protein